VREEGEENQKEKEKQRGRQIMRVMEETERRKEKEW
jgi:hypothetical protein